MYPCSFNQKLEYAKPNLITHVILKISFYPSPPCVVDNGLAPIKLAMPVFVASDFVCHHGTERQIKIGKIGKNTIAT